MEMVFKEVNVHEYCLRTHKDMFWYYATISKNTEKAREYHVRLPKESTMDLISESAHVG